MKNRWIEQIYLSKFAKEKQRLSETLIRSQLEPEIFKKFWSEGAWPDWAYEKFDELIELGWSETDALTIMNSYLNRYDN